MKKPITILSLLLVPAVLIILGFYFKQDILSSIGYVILIFYIIMVIRGKFSTSQKESK